MPSLLFNLDGNLIWGVLPERAKIGRLQTNGVWLPDASVSRLHAWIQCSGDTCTIHDCRHSAGTIINGDRIFEPCKLNDGDRIALGQVRLIYLQSDLQPEGVIVTGFADQPCGHLQDIGIIFDCTCKAPLWARWSELGKLIECRNCRHVMKVPVDEKWASSEVVTTAENPFSDFEPISPKARISPVEPITIVAKPKEEEDLFLAVYQLAGKSCGLRA